MAITKPKLIPVKGYVEVEVNGRRLYKDIETGLTYESYDVPRKDNVNPEKTAYDEMAAAYTQGVNSI